MSSRPPFELHPRRSWVAFLGVMSIAVAALSGATALTAAPERDPAGAAVSLVLATALLLLVVLPSGILFVRAATGIPDVRLDDRGAVWGRDRSRDLSIDWPDVSRVATRTLRGRYVAEPMFILEPRGEAGRSPARTGYGRVVAWGNRLRFGSPFVISAALMNHSMDEVAIELAARLPAAPIRPG